MWRHRILMHIREKRSKTKYLEPHFLNFELNWIYSQIFDYKKIIIMNKRVHVQPW